MPKLLCLCFSECHLLQIKLNQNHYYENLFMENNENSTECGWRTLLSINYAQVLLCTCKCFRYWKTSWKEWIYQKMLLVFMATNSFIHRKGSLTTNWYIMAPSDLPDSSNIKFDEKYKICKFGERKLVFEESKKLLDLNICFLKIILKLQYLPIYMNTLMQTHFTYTNI